MEPAEPPARPRRPHLLDALALAAALAASVVLYAVLFRRTEVPRPVDPLLGIVLEVDFEADIAWKREFPKTGTKVLIDELLAADVEAVGDAPERPGRRRVRLRVRAREGQEPSAILGFRWGIARGSRVSVADAPGEGRPVSTVSGEIVSVTAPVGK